MKPATVSRRCAIYTRVSTDHGLEQDFNSLDAQCEAAEAYVKSQTHEGWRLVKSGVFADGGFSGGSMDRPALQRLLALIRTGGVDVIVVYKVDRLTRSLADFAKLVELFDAHGVSFVSVTQLFNTTTSMGRLILNMLLSFAQFEREVTSERIRDKIAASKKRGIWVGGSVPLGYRVEARKLLIDEAEAETVRLVFELYLTLPSLSALQAELRTRGIVTRKRTLSSGRTVGGVHLTNGSLSHMLRNRTYLGEINHKGSSYPGEHLSIVSIELFAAANDKLVANARSRRAKHEASGALLLGKLFDDRGHPMTPSTAVKMGIRYYVSAALAQGRRQDAGSVKRIPSKQIENAIVAALRERSDQEQDNREIVAKHPTRATVSVGQIELELIDRQAVSIASPKPGRTRELIMLPEHHNARPMRAENRAVLLRWIALGRRWLADLSRGGASDLNALALREGCTRRHVERMIGYAFLAPDLVKAIAGETLRAVSALRRLPMLRLSGRSTGRGLASPAKGLTVPTLTSKKNLNDAYARTSNEHFDGLARQRC